MTTINIASITQETALQRAKNYRGAKEGLQVAIAWAVGQALQGNADGIFMILNAGGLLANEEGVMTTYADGRQVWKYLTTSQDDGGIGLKGVIRWSKDDNKFKMVKNWAVAANQLDMVQLVETLSHVRWDKFAKVAASKAFDLDKAIKSLVTRAANNGISEMDVKQAFARLAA